MITSLLRTRTRFFSRHKLDHCFSPLPTISVPLLQELSPVHDFFLVLLPRHPRSGRQRLNGWFLVALP